MQSNLCGKRVLSPLSAVPFLLESQLFSILAALPSKSKHYSQQNVYVPSKALTKFYPISVGSSGIPQRNIQLASKGSNLLCLLSFNAAASTEIIAFQPLRFPLAFLFQMVFFTFFLLLHCCLSVSLVSLTLYSPVKSGTKTTKHFKIRFLIPRESFPYHFLCHYPTYFIDKIPQW